MIADLLERATGRLNSLFHREPPRTAAAPGARFHSRFGGLWTDRLDTG